MGSIDEGHDREKLGKLEEFEISPDAWSWLSKRSRSCVSQLPSAVAVGGVAIYCPDGFTCIDTRGAAGTGDDDDAVDSLG